MKGTRLAGRAPFFDSLGMEVGRPSATETNVPIYRACNLRMTHKGFGFQSPFTLRGRVNHDSEIEKDCSSASVPPLPSWSVGNCHSALAELATS